MDDPNVIYKLAYANLTRELGRNPTSNELLSLHDAYKRAWGPASATLLPPVRAAEPLTNPGAGENASEAESPPEPVPINPRPAERPIVGTRGPGGGIMATCRRCHASFERPARKGRPPVECETCRD